MMSHRLWLSALQARNDDFLDHHRLFRSICLSGDASKPLNTAALNETLGSRRRGAALVVGIQRY
jgi:hypothetical protein